MRFTRPRGLAMRVRSCSCGAEVEEVRVQQFSPQQAVATEAITPPPFCAPCTAREPARTHHHVAIQGRAVGVEGLRPKARPGVQRRVHDHWVAVHVNRLRPAPAAGRAAGGGRQGAAQLPRGGRPPWRRRHRPDLYATGRRSSQLQVLTSRSRQHAVPHSQYAYCPVHSTSCSPDIAPPPHRRRRRRPAAAAP